MGCCRLLSGVLPPAPVRSFPFPGIAGCTSPAVFVCAWGSALPAAAALAFPRSPGAGPPSRPPVRPRARLPGFPGVRSGRLFQPLSRSNRPFGPSGAGKWLSGVPGAAQGHPERRLSPCRRRGLLLGLPRPAPPFGSQRPAGPFSAPWRYWKRFCGLKARTGASWGRPGLFSPSARASFLDPGPFLALRSPQGRSQPRGGIGSVGSGPAA